MKTIEMIHTLRCVTWLVWESDNMRSMYCSDENFSLTVPYMRGLKNENESTLNPFIDDLMSLSVKSPVYFTYMGVF